MSPKYDVIVLGLGGMGSAAAAELARRGARVLGLEQFTPAHARGSSHGRTRIIRTAYYEHPAYVPLVRRAFAGWHALEAATGRSLLTACPCLTAGPAAGELVAGVRAAVRGHSLPAEELTAADIGRRFPPLRLPSDFVGTLEEQSGYLRVEECVRAALDVATSRGAELHFDEPARFWRASHTGVTVTTGRLTYHAAKLVVTAGPWATQLINYLGVPLRVMRQTMHWFVPPTDPAAFGPARFPIFLADTPAGAFYGLPMINAHGAKVARHYGAPEEMNPAAVSEPATAADADPVRAFLREHLPSLDGPPAESQACIYTLTPDRHFVIGPHPVWANVSVACGFSGHGFKFAPAVGEVLADLALGGATGHDIRLFRPGRVRDDDV